MLTARQIVSQYEPFYENEGDNFVKDYTKDCARYGRLAEKYLQLLQIDSYTAKILDLACGTGVVTIELAARGFDCTGIDLSPICLKIARQLSAKRGVEVDWLHSDIRNIEYNSIFDIVLFWDVIFGIFTEEENFKLLKSIAAALVKKGKCLLEVYNKEFAVKNGIENIFTYDEKLDLFVADANKSSIPYIQLLSISEWDEWTAKAGLKIKNLDGWCFPADPDEGPLRVNYIICEKI
ncbi:class I SAM-dependent methyltransferase [Candidatus Riflebacteria bacterium]